MLAAVVAALLIPAMQGVSEGNTGSASAGAVPGYSEVSRLYPDVSSGSRSAVTIQGRDYAREGGGAALVASVQGAESGPVVTWGKAGHWLEWGFDVAKAGRYTVTLRYMPGEAAGGPPAFILRSLELDGSVPFAEMTEIRLPRAWSVDRSSLDDLYAQTKRVGTALPPSFRDLTENRVWLEQTLDDWRTSRSEPYEFYLAAGKHRIRLIARARALGIQFPLHDEYMTLDWIRLAPAPGDAESMITEEQKISSAHGAAVTIQGENYFIQGGRAFQWFESTDDGPVAASGVTPRGAALFVREDAEPAGVYNSLGNFSVWGQWVRWRFSVPVDGVYLLTFKYALGGAREVSFADFAVRIDGAFAFPGAQSIRFYGTGGKARGGSSTDFGDFDILRWGALTLRDGNGRLGKVRLRAGEHVLELKMMLGPTQVLVSDRLKQLKVSLDADARIIVSRARALDDLAKLPQDPEIRQVLGKLESYSAIFEELIKDLKSYNEGRESSVSGLLRVAKDVTKRLAKEPRLLSLGITSEPGTTSKLWDTLIGNVSSAYGGAGAVGQAVTQGGVHPVDIDSIVISSADRIPVMPGTSGWYRIGKLLRQFVATFTWKQF